MLHDCCSCNLYTELHLLDVGCQGWDGTSHGTHYHGTGSCSGPHSNSGVPVGHLFHVPGQ